MIVKTLAQIKLEEDRMPTIEEITEFYEEIAMPRKSDGWFGSIQHIDVGFGRVQFCLEHIKPGMSVLEVGCADGGVSQHLIEAVGPNGFLTLVDIAPTFIDRAQKLIPNKNVEFVVGDANKFTTRRRYDVIVVMELLEHVTEPRRLLTNIWGLLRKGSGKILITVPVDWEDTLGEHLHQFESADVANIIGDSTGLHVPIEQCDENYYAVIDKKNKVLYVP